MNNQIRRIASSFLMWCLIMVMTWPGATIAMASESDTGEITVEIVPPTDGGVSPSAPTPPDSPGTSGSPGSPGGSAVQEPRSASGTLSVSLMWLPDPAPGQTRLHGMLAVQDHRARADGWTVRLQGDPANSAFVVEVVVGQTGFGIPEWLYQGIHAWDVSVGAPLGEAPQIVTAPKPAGYSLTIHQLWLAPAPQGPGTADSVQTLVLILPFAP